MIDKQKLREVVKQVVEERLGAPASSDQQPVVAPRIPRLSDEVDYKGRELIGEREVAEAHREGRTLVIAPGALVTPAARDAISRWRVPVEEGRAPSGAGNIAVAAASAGCRKGRVAIGADHGGFEMKQALVQFLETEAKIPCLDLGTWSADPVDYPDVARRVAQAVVAGDCCRGILVDGAGIGSSIAANKVKGIRAAQCSSLAQVTNAREHNDANVLCLGGRMLPLELARALAIVFLKTDFAGGRHLGRVRKIAELER